MNMVSLDFTGIKSLWDLHEYFKEVFDLPDYYGHNMDALWDCLHCMFDDPVVIVLKNIELLPKDLDEAVKIMLDLFADLEKEDEEVTLKIESTTGDDSDFSSYLI